MFKNHFSKVQIKHEKEDKILLEKCCKELRKEMRIIRTPIRTIRTPLKGKHE